MTPEEKEECLLLFEELLRFPTISFAGPTNGSYRACAQWLVKTLSDLGLETQVRKERAWCSLVVCELRNGKQAKYHHVFFLRPRHRPPAPPLLC